MAYYRERYDAERERADRLQDAMLAMHGQEPVTDTVLSERSDLQARQQSARNEREKQLAEMFAESLEEVQQDGLELPDELKIAAQGLVNG